jgi:adenosine deaminase
MDTVELAIKWREKWKNKQGEIVGVDFSGNPSITDVTPFMPALRRAKDAGFKLSLHISEIPGNFDTDELLSLHPDRIGHGTFLHPQNGGKQNSVDFIVNNHIPIELCLTSNIKSGTVDRYENHHFGFWYRKHLLILCTDDKGVFSTTLSSEYERAAKSFNLSREDLQKLCLDSIDVVFDDAVKEHLRTLLHVTIGTS